MADYSIGHKLFNLMSKENFKEVETIIGPSVKVEGDFKSNGNVIVEGEVVGSLTTKNSLRVGEAARIKANIEAENAWIGGEVKGNLVIKNHLELSANAKIKGDVQTQLLTMETGAQLIGHLKMGENVAIENVEEKNKES